MSKFARQNLLFAISGLCFIGAGLRDLFVPGFLTLNTEPTSKSQIGIAMAIGLVFIGVAAFRTLHAPRDQSVDSDSPHD